ncbi:cytochrome b-c1 complex subunit 9, partial [Hyaloraphidium curvatum]
LARTIYNTFMRRNAVYYGAIFAGAFLFEVGFDNLSDKVWDDVNKGRQWKDIRGKY